MVNTLTEYFDSQFLSTQLGSNVQSLPGSLLP